MKFKSKREFQDPANVCCNGGDCIVFQDLENYHVLIYHMYLYHVTSKSCLHNPWISLFLGNTTGRVYTLPRPQSQNQARSEYLYKNTVLKASREHYLTHSFQDILIFSLEEGKIDLNRINTLLLFAHAWQGMMIFIWEVSTAILFAVQ